MADLKLPGLLSEAQVPSLPDGAFYIPEFLTEAEEELILDKVCVPIVQIKLF